MTGSTTAGDSSLSIVVVHPDLLGTYGDGGNGLVLARRASWRGMNVELVEAPSDRPLPALGNIYCLGGGEDGPQVRSAAALADDGALVRSVADGATVLAVCAGFQIVGRSFPAADGTPLEGLGLLDVVTTKGRGPRAVGELLAEPAGQMAGLPSFTGFENHGGTTALGAEADPLGNVLLGVGNGIEHTGTHAPGEIGGTAIELAGARRATRVDGAVSGRVVGTYLHGPVLARNPALADRLLEWATGVSEPLAPLDDTEEQALRAERLAVAGAHPLHTGRGSLRRWHRRR